MQTTARCVHCRSDVAVPDSYAHGDHIRCGSCGTQHKVNRGEILRLVLADVGPLRDALRTNQQMIKRLEAELAQARGSFGIGVNGLLIGLAYVIYQVAVKEEAIAAGLLWEAVGIALVTGVALEAANLLFFAKRQRIQRLNSEIAEARQEGRLLQTRIRDSSRV
jgi:hypothetical protein